MSSHKEGQPIIKTDNTFNTFSLLVTNIFFFALYKLNPVIIRPRKICQKLFLTTARGSQSRISLLQIIKIAINSCPSSCLQPCKGILQIHRCSHKRASSSLHPLNLGLAMGLALANGTLANMRQAEASRGLDHWDLPCFCWIRLDSSVLLD